VIFKPAFNVFVLLGLSTFIGACRSAATSNSSASQSCDSAAEHLIDVCEPSTGEDFRLCYDASSQFYKTFSKIAALDGGAE
jgi:hypothetical protein